MANLINEYYFVRYLSLGISDSDATEIKNLNREISLYEPEFLLLLMGQSLYDAYSSNPTEDRFVKLISGDTGWQGLVNSTLKTSPIANYVFYKVVKNKATAMSVVGAVGNNTDNSTRVNPVNKLVEAWQQMADINWQFAKYVTDNSEVYPEWDKSSPYCYPYLGIYRGIGHVRKCNPLFDRNGGGNKIW